MTPLRAPTGTSSTVATRTLANAGLQLCFDELTRVLEGDAVEHVAEESLDQHSLRGHLRDAARAQVEQVVRIDRADGRAMGAAHVVAVDLEHGDGGGLRLVAQDEIAVRLVRVRARGVLLDANEAGVDGARVVLQRPFEEEVAACVPDLMV